MNAFMLMALAALVLCIAFAALYLLARRLDNYGIVDIAWSYAFAGVAIAYAVLADGWSTRRLVMAAMVSVWSLRLGTHLLVRIAQHHPVEDTRYVTLRRDWAADFAVKMFGFFQLQAVSIVVLSVGFLLPALNSYPQLHALEIAGVLLWLFAIGGETVADAQLAAFKRDPSNRGKVCDRGLWRYSRHPNYFFEWLIWVAYFVFALPSPHGWIAILGPAVILFLLLRVTGIPMAEAQSVQSKGDAYRRYQATTSAFVPWWRKIPNA
jgi:steroid 5-alpha reductase family enzyme